MVLFKVFFVGYSFYPFSFGHIVILIRITKEIFFVIKGKKFFFLLQIRRRFVPQYNTCREIKKDIGKLINILQLINLKSSFAFEIICGFFV